MEQEIAHIESYAAKAGIQPNTLCFYAGKDGHFYSRLKDGRVLPKSVADVIRYIDEHPLPSEAAGGCQA